MASEAALLTLERLAQTVGLGVADATFERLRHSVDETAFFLLQGQTCESRSFLVLQPDVAAVAERASA